MKLVVVFFVLIFGIQGIANSQYANPFISMNMTPGNIQLNKTATLEIQAGNIGNTPIQPNSLLIILNAGNNGEITGIREKGSDSRWSIKSLDKGAGNTMVLTNSGNSPLISFDLGKIYVLFTGTSTSEKPVAVIARIEYAKNYEQGNASTLDDQTQTSLWVSSGTTPDKTVKTAPTVIPEKQDLSISANGCDVILNWKIAASKKVERIDVEYSKNSFEFVNQGNAAPKEGGSPGEYEYKKDQGNGKGYYRLKLVLAGNSVEYSKIKEITTTCIIKKGF